MKIAINSWPTAAVVIAAIVAGVVLILSGHHLPGAVWGVITTGLVSILPPVFALVRKELEQAVGGEGEKPATSYKTVEPKPETKPEAPEKDKPT